MNKNILTLFLVVSGIFASGQGIIIGPSKKDPNFYLPPLNISHYENIVPFTTTGAATGILCQSKGSYVCLVKASEGAWIRYKQERNDSSIAIGTNKCSADPGDRFARDPECNLYFTKIIHALQNKRNDYFFGLTSRGEMFYFTPADTLLHKWRAMTPNGQLFRQILACENANGTILLMALSMDGSVHFDMQTSAIDVSSEAWTGWHSLYGSNLKQIACTPGIDGRIVLFALSNDGSVYHIWQSEPGSLNWSNWAPLGGSGLRKIAVTSTRDGRLALFAIGDDYRVYKTEQTFAGGIWTDWTTLNGSHIVDISGETSGGGRFIVFGLTGEGSIEHCWQWEPGGPAWSDWAPLGSGFSMFATQRLPDGSMNVIGDSKTGLKAKKQKFSDGDWGDWLYVNW